MSTIEQSVLSLVSAARRSRPAMAILRLAMRAPGFAQLGRATKSMESGAQNRRLEGIASRAVAKDATFAARIAAAETIEGMFPRFSMAVVDSLLSFQGRTGLRGHMVEMGVFRGKSVALIGTHLGDAEKLVLVDLKNLLDPAATAPFGAAVECFFGGTERFETGYRGYDKLLGACRFVHIDASHNYRPTYSELKMADALLAPGGIIAMDDFANLHYSQNMAAIFKYLFTAPTQLMIFLVTDQKAYLCRKDDFPRYGQFVLNDLLAEMESRGEISTLARTDMDPEYRAFYLAPRAAGEGPFYGHDIDVYQKMLQRP
jgi:predicted O-methyltransferase YrrM